MGLTSRRAPVHHPVHDIEDQPIIVFVTVCSAERKPILANDLVARTIIGSWVSADSWLVGRYVILPDHLHLFCSPRDHAIPVKRWVKFWKSQASRRWPTPSDHPIWQVDCWDTQLRRGESYANKWEYVRFNPVRHGLVATPDEWPYQGELNVLLWDD